MNAGQKLVELSGLASGSALEHFSNLSKASTVVLSKCIISVKSISVLIAGFSSTVDTIVKSVIQVTEPNVVKKYKKPETICRVSSNTPTRIVVKSSNVSMALSQIDYDLSSDQTVICINRPTPTTIRL